MDGFKKAPKIACFKEGGQVGYKSRKEHSESKEMSADIKQDKAIVKKAVGQHESAKHKGEGKTELKLKCGGRAKKDTGTVKKYKKGGEVIGMKKTADDKKDIAGIKKKGSAPKKAAPKTKQAPAKPMGMAPAEMPMTEELPMFENGGNVLERAGRRLRDNVMGTPEQNEAARKQLDRVAQQPGSIGAMERAIRGIKTAPMPTTSGGAKTAPMPTTSGGERTAPMPTTEGAGAVSDEERALLKGITAIGRACGGAI